MKAKHFAKNGGKISLLVFCSVHIKALLAPSSEKTYISEIHRTNISPLRLNSIDPRG